VEKILAKVSDRILFGTNPEKLGVFHIYYILIGHQFYQILNGIQNTVQHINCGWQN
jgi:hypothetical protein